MPFTITATLDPSWLEKMATLPQRLIAGAEEGMEVAMRQSEQDMVGAAGWKHGGLQHDQAGRPYEVSELSRATLVGYVLGKGNPFTAEGADIVDRFRHHHRATSRVVGPWASVGEHPMAGRELVTGVLTLYTEYASYLQRYEREGIAGSGIEVVLKVLHANRGFIFNTCRLHMLQAIGL